ncbi:urokinase plasminogen activator surface receptor isoform X2 [Perognathus longimembris pacificus]|uniref:urokinase plasminogen activator surface receptor isoform X2 n=1 Tax=Perognathus longimembris pacificus TaxID=214514 RepID=UPI00201A08EE|nr:urokinase plasminogen activator surface receptor isoform X2 [Perognathus longimembris pacificus]
MTSWALSCVRCDSNERCEEEECAPGLDLCRTTVLRIWEDDVEEVERGCADLSKTNRTMSYRVEAKIFSLWETVCGSDLCNQPRPGRAPSFPMGRYLECMSCSSLGMSCERGREQSLQCRHPREQCLEVVTYHSLGTHTGSRKDEQHIRGCGRLPGCPGPTGFHSNDTFHFLRCCNSTKCNQGPVVQLQDLPPNAVECYSCEGNGTHGCSSEEAALIPCRGPMDRCLEATGTKGMDNLNYTVRGCATASWCEGSHVADIFSLTRVSASCCTGNGCNHPAGDAQYRSGGGSRPRPAYLGLTMTLLMTARLGGGLLLWT